MKINFNKFIKYRKCILLFSIVQKVCEIILNEKKVTNLEPEDEVPEEAKGLLQMAVDNVAGSDPVRQS
jgi:hypothetical protein